MSQIHGGGGVHSKALNLVGQRVHILAQVHVSAEGIFIHGNLRDARVDGVALSFVHGHSALFQQLPQILPNSMVLAKAYLLNESEKLKLDDLSC